MGNRLIYAFIVFIGIAVLGGCGISHTANETNNSVSTDPKTLTNNQVDKPLLESNISTKNDNNNKVADNQKETQLLDQFNEYHKWNGIWSMGISNETGANAIMTIRNADKNKFEFSINATYANTFVNEKGQKVLNPHVGNVEGIAYFTSSKEAYFTFNDCPDYKMIFIMPSNTNINIEEVNIKTGQDYYSSPGAGLNVRYFGDYVIKDKKNYNENLCADDEDVLFSFKTDSSDKKLSVCLSKKPLDYIVYRFGTKEKIEFEFPENKADSWSKFAYSFYLRGGGKQNDGLDLNYLSFENGEFEYKIYQEYSAIDSIEKVGVRVIEKRTNKETDIKGSSNTIKGTLISLRGNNKIKVKNM